MYKNITKNSPDIWYIDVGNGEEILLADHYKLELTAFDSLNMLGVSVVVGSLAASAMVGSYCKSAIYHYMYRMIQESGVKAMDVLILVNTVTQHLICLFLVFVYSVGLTGDITYSDHVNEIWCNLPWYAGIYGICYRTFGSLGMAIYPLLLIKRNDWVVSIGKKTLGIVVLLFSIMISIGTTIGFGTGNGPASRKQVTWNWCVGRNENLREILHEYSLISGTVTSESEFLAKLSILTTILGVVSELFCYLMFFSHLHSNDKHLLTRKIIKEVE